MCAGPFSFVERVPQDHITLERFPQYWDAKDIHFDKVIYQVIVDSSARLANLKASAVDLAEYHRADRRGSGEGGSEAAAGDVRFAWLFRHHQQPGERQAADNPYGQNALVRQAFSLAIDRQALVNVVFNGMNVPTMQAVPTSSPFYDAVAEGAGA